jgi:CRP-like cAMP-binding protein
MSGNFSSSHNPARLPIFQDLNDAQWAQLQPLFSEFGCTADSVIYEQGGPAEFLYLVVEGEVQVRYKPEDGPALTLTRVPAGGVVGWSAALGNPMYTSSAVPTGDCRLLRIRSADLRQLYRQDPETGGRVLELLAEVIAERLRNTHEHVMALLEQGLRLSVRSSHP